MTELQETPRKESSHLGAVEVANHLLERFGAAKRISSLKDFGEDYFVVLYEALTAEPLRGVERYCQSKESRARNCQFVIDALAKDVLETDLSHISGKEIVNGNIISIGNLLEIFMDVLECVFEDLQNEEAEKKNAEEDDSNLLPDDHDILSDVIQEEFGESSSNKSRDLSNRKSHHEPGHLDLNSYLIVKEQPTRDDLESQSSLDFTADSLFNIEGRKTVINRQPAPATVQMPPFAYFSSSGSNSTEDLTKEAIAYQEKANISGKKDSSRLSSSKKRKNEHDAKDQKPNEKSQKSTPTFTSTMQNQKQAKQPSAAASVSSGSWPSILSANELNTPSAKAASSFKNVDSRQTNMPSRDIDNASEKSSDSSGSSVVHKHTHHHYYHYPETKDISKSAKRKQDESINSWKPESKLSSSKKSNSASSLARSEQSKLLPGDLIGQAKDKSDSSNGINDSKAERNRSVVSTSVGHQMSVTPVVQGSLNNISTMGRSVTRSVRLDKSKRDDAVNSKLNDIATNTSVLGLKESSAKDVQSVRVRSVQTSVSDMPEIQEQPQPTATQQASSIVQQESRDGSNSETNGSNSDTQRSVLSSVSELNDLLNKHPGQRQEAGSRFDVLQELEKKLQEVRASVAKIEANENDEKKSTEDKVKDLRRFLDKDSRRSKLGSFENGMQRRKTESICSDSEFDYGERQREARYTVAEKEYGVDKRRTDISKETKSNQTVESSSNDDEILPEVVHRRKKKVAFQEIGKESRDERLDRLVRLLKTEEKENDQAIATVRGKYSKDFHDFKEKQADKSKENKTSIGKTSKSEKSKPLLSKTTPNKSASRLARIYGSRSRKPGRSPCKPRKRSASSSPVPRARRRGRLVLEEDDIIPVMEEEFPHLYLSPVTAKLMWQKQMHQISNLTKASQLRKPTKIQKQIEDAKKKQDALMNIMKKELEHNKRLKETKEKANQQRLVKTKLRERRLASARARRYYDEYQVRMRARMLKRRTKEEKIFKHLFEDALEIQKQRVRELRRYAKEQREMDAKAKQNELESLENFYRDRFAMMADSVARERYELQVRQKAQSKIAEKMRKAIRQRMENDIRELQEELVREEDSTYFRQLDAENLKREFQLATYKTRL